MCGILLSVSEENIRPTHPALEIIKHRGPDGYGSRNFTFGDFITGLGHRRLSIIDLSERGSQPMSYQNENLWITYNGEVYNYIEIRKQLSSEGYEFKSDCDTEVILAAYSRWGNACLNQFNGMFSFAILDMRKRKLFIARDRLGIKPLYIYNKKNSFRAVSEIKQLTAFNDFHAELNREKLYHFLNSGDFSFDESTMWKDVYELPPGHFLEINLDSWKPGDDLKALQWYKLPYNDDKLTISFDDAVAEFRRLLDLSVKFRLRADVPVGFLLSGGLDSSTLVALAHQIPRDKDAHLKTYSSCYEDKKIDEREFIYAMLDHTGADACLHFPKPEDISANLDKVIWHNDLPILHGSPVPHWLLYEHIKKENDSRIVMLEGQGADEILCGYGDFYWAFLNEQLKLKSMGSFLREFSIFQKYHHEPLKIVLRKYMRLRFPNSVKYPSNPFIRHELLLENDYKIPSIAVKREEATVSELHRNRLTILRYILHNVDRNSMSQSRETRVPYLDYNLVEFCLRLPSAYKISGGLSKRVLREAVKEVLPDKVYKRVDKQGYSSPVARWAAKELNGFFRENLEKAVELPFVEKKKLMESFQKFSEGKAPFDPVWWRLITTKKWIDIFKVKL